MSKKTLDSKEFIKLHWKKILFNKYFIATTIFIIWMFFFDTNSFFTHKSLNKEIDKLETEKKYYQEIYTKDSINLKTLQYNKEEREKYARENYFVKKKNEDIFIIVHENDSLNSKP